MASLCDVIRPLPDLRIVKVGCNVASVTREVARHVRECGGTIDLYEYGESSLAIDDPVVRRMAWPDPGTPPRLTARAYETVIVTDILHRLDDPKTLLRTLYRALENSGVMIAVLPSDGSVIRRAVADMESIGLLAVNSIDFDHGTTIICGKKMHMWDRGL